MILVIRPSEANHIGGPVNRCGNDGPEWPGITLKSVNSDQISGEYLDQAN